MSAMIQRVIVTGNPSGKDYNGIIKLFVSILQYSTLRKIIFQWTAPSRPRSGRPSEFTPKSQIFVGMTKQIRNLYRTLQVSVSILYAKFYNSIIEKKSGRVARRKTHEYRRMKFQVVCWTRGGVEVEGGFIIPLLLTVFMISLLYLFWTFVFVLDELAFASSLCVYSFAPFIVLSLFYGPDLWCLPSSKSSVPSKLIFFNRNTTEQFVMTNTLDSYYICLYFRISFSG